MSCSRGWRRPGDWLVDCDERRAPDLHARCASLWKATEPRPEIGVRMVSTEPRSLDQDSVEAAQDALIDLWLLRATRVFVGTTGSSFSHMAAFGRRAVLVSVAGSTRGYRVAYWAVRLTGVHWLIRRLFHARRGLDRPFPKAWDDLVAAPSRHCGRAAGRS